jgi:hypothetical protein
MVTTEDIYIAELIQTVLQLEEDTDDEIYSKIIKT